MYTGHFAPGVKLLVEGTGALSLGHHPDKLYERLTAGVAEWGWTVYLARGFFLISVLTTNTVSMHGQLYSKQQLLDPQLFTSYKGIMSLSNSRMHLNVSGEDQILLWKIAQGVSWQAPNAAKGDVSRASKSHK